MSGNVELSDDETRISELESANRELTNTVTDLTNEGIEAASDMDGLRTELEYCGQTVDV